MFRRVGPLSSLKNVSGGGWKALDEVTFVPGAIVPNTFVKPFQQLSASLNMNYKHVMESNDIAQHMP